MKKDLTEYEWEIIKNAIQSELQDMPKEIAKDAEEIIRKIRKDVDES